MAAEGRIDGRVHHRRYRPEQINEAYEAMERGARWWDGRSS
jgi:D-arabinose 1-dehydrogenase-like Zn-dependent alcohol dehydrogenase